MAIMESSSERLQRFLEEQSFETLEGKAVEFDKEDGFNNFLCCQGACILIGSLGLGLLCCPIQTLCPSRLFKDFSLRLDDNSVQMHSVTNDCCCHVASTHKTVPLEKIQDVELTESWFLTLFGLQQVNVQTAGQGSNASGEPAPEIAASYLRNPAQARDAIALAARLAREGALAAPGQMGGMRRGAAKGSLAGRLDALTDLQLVGALDEAEAASVRVAVLAAEGDPLRRLREAHDLQQRGRITAGEFGQLKALILRQLLATA